MKRERLQSLWVTIGRLLPDLVLRGGVSAANFVVILVISVKMSVDALGVYTLALMTISLIYRIHSFNLYQFTTREIATADPKVSSVIFWRQIAIQLVWGLVVLPTLGWLCFKAFVHPEFLGWIVAIYAINFAASQLELYSVALGGVRLFALSQFVRNAAWVPFFLAAAFLFEGANSLSFVFAFSLFSQIIGLLLIASILFSRGALGLPCVTWDSSWAKRAFKVSSLYFLANFSDQAIDFANKGALKFLVGEAAVGVYTFYVSVANVALVMVQTTITFRIIPRFVRDVYSGLTADSVGRLIRNGVIGVVLGAMILFAVYMPLNWLLAILNQQELQDNLYLLLISGLGVIMLIAGSFVHLFLYANNADRAILLTSVMSAILGLIVCFPLITIFGLVGALMAYLVGAVALLAVRCMIALAAYQEKSLT